MRKFLPQVIYYVENYVISTTFSIFMKVYFIVISLVIKFQVVMEDTKPEEEQKDDKQGKEDEEEDEEANAGGVQCSSFYFI